MINVKLWPNASASLKPKIRLAAAFHPTMFPLGSATTTASPSTLNNCARSSCMFIGYSVPKPGRLGPGGSAAPYIELPLYSPNIAALPGFAVEKRRPSGRPSLKHRFGCLNGFCRVQPGNVFLSITEIAQNFVGVLAQHGGGCHFDLQVRELDRAADRQVLAANLVVDVDDRAALAQVGGLRQFLHRENRRAWNVELAQNVDRFVLGLVLEPLFDRLEDVEDLVLTRFGRHIGGVFGPLGFADGSGDRLPRMALNGEIDVSVRVGFPTLTFQDPTGLSAAAGIAAAGHDIGETAMRVLRVLLEVADFVQAL